MKWLGRASICALNDCQPREVYESHLDELLTLLKLPGKAYRSTPSADIIIPADAFTGPRGPANGMDIASSLVPWSMMKMPRSRVNDQRNRPEKLRPIWLQIRSRRHECVSNIQNQGSENSYFIQAFSQAHPNRSTKTPVTVRHENAENSFTINQRLKSKDDVVNLTELNLKKQDEVIVTIGTEGADGNVHVDAVRF